MNNNKKTIILIPARIGSTRLPNKPLLKINGKEMILHVWENAISSIADKVIVATDSKNIHDLVEDNGGQSIITKQDHESGTDRIYEAIQKFDENHEYDYIINLQGDLPNVSKEVIDIGIKKIQSSTADILTYCRVIDTIEDIQNPNIVKIATGKLIDGEMNAIYFSRSPVPNGADKYYEHIGIYIYKRDAIDKFISSKPTKLEKTEKLEQLRAIENGLKINLILIDDNIISIDTIDDISRLKNNI
ncbi:MAG: 3-deoxy-manno-octulosonate cytidylyltransferase [Hyphomicrobiales bacterium]|jgi:3-deoxy-manno-octulosonate cytidylyltransferase (CMP-KDO synthetase)|nr:3-deoxy-manno-octulosonate cytidylyltransferase [Hyphomicrobiales bacterium]